MRILLVPIALCSWAVTIGCNDPRLAPPDTAAPPAAASSAAAQAPSPEGREDDLKRWMQDLQTVASQDPGTATTLARSLALDSPEAFFHRVFGEEPGTRMAAEYAPLVPELDDLVPLLAELHDAGQTHVVIERFSHPDDPASVEYQALALERMRQPTPLYSVRFTTANEAMVFHLWSFVFQSGRFRWVGKLKGVSNEAVPNYGLDLREFRLRDFTRARQALGQ